MSDLTVEEMKALRLCRCGNWKHGCYQQCNQCYLLFGSSPGSEDAFYADLDKVKAGEMEYTELFKHLDTDIPSRKALLLIVVMRNKIRISEEDFIFARKNIERRLSKKRQTKTASDRRRISGILGEATTVFNGFNTASG